MKRTTLLLTISVFAAVAMFAPAVKPHFTALPVVHAQSGCTNDNLTGNYAFIQPSGFIAPGHSVTGAEVPWQAIGVLTFDGTGNFSANYTAVVNGAVFTSQPASGPYTINSDCTGSLTFMSGPAAGYAANLVLVGGGTEIFGIATGRGDTAAWDAKKQ